MNNKILGALMAGACVVALGASATAADLTLIVAHNSTNEEHPYSYGIAKFKEVAEDISGGAIEVITHNGTLGENESELIEKLDMGAADIVVSSPGFMTGIGVPEVDFLSLEYLFSSFDHWAGAVDGEFGDAMKEVISSRTPFRVVGYWSSGVRDVYAKQPVTKPEDMKGLKIRTQNSKVQQDFFQACGAIPTNVAWGELYQGLQQGVVDGAENDYTSFSLKEHHKTENGKYINETHHDYTTRLFLMKNDKYNSLTDEQKGWLDEAAKAATEEERAVTMAKYDESKARCIEDGAIITENADIDIAAFVALAEPIQDDFAAANNMTEYLDMVRAAK